jgi:hypothetical protein
LSLILEALKKLDREKKAPDRGFLVVGAVPWPAPRARAWPPLLLVVAAGVAAGSALWLAWRARGHEEAPARAVTSTTMAAAAAPRATAVPVVAAPPSTLPPLVESRMRVPLTPPAAERRAAEADPPAAAPAAAPAAVPAAGLLLQAISERDGKPIAVLNGRVVHEGDHFDGVTILRIGKDDVEIEVQGHRRILRF